MESNEHVGKLSTALPSLTVWNKRERKRKSETTLRVLSGETERGVYR